MHYHKLIAFLVLFSFTGFSQGKMLESLKLDLKSAKHDTIRCDVLDQLIEIAADGEWQKYNEDMKQLASKNLALKPSGRLLVVYSKYYATALHNQGIIYSEQSNDDKAVEYFEIRALGYPFTPRAKSKPKEPDEIVSTSTMALSPIFITVPLP